MTERKRAKERQKIKIHTKRKIGNERKKRYIEDGEMDCLFLAKINEFFLSKNTIQKNMVSLVSLYVSHNLSKKL